MSQTDLSHDTFERLRSVVADQLGVNINQVTLKASFADDLGADSLDTVELVMAIEEEFGIDIPDEYAEKIGSVEEAIEFIDSFMNV